MPTQPPNAPPPPPPLGPKPMENMYPNIQEQPPTYAH